MQIYFPARDMFASLTNAFGLWLSISKLLDEYARFGKPVRFADCFVPRDCFASYLATPRNLRLTVHITELGVRCAEDKPPTSQESEQLRRTRGDWHQSWCEKVQADWMEWFYTMAYARDEIEAITWWDFRDPAFIKTSGFLYEDETPKEIYFRLRALREKLLS